MVIFVKGRMAKGANYFEVERKALSELKNALQKLGKGKVKQLDGVVPTFQIGSLIVEAYDKFQRAGSRRFERWYIVAIGDGKSDGEVKVVEVKGASKVVPTAKRILKQLLS
jgi:hypothetical protein